MKDKELERGGDRGTSASYALHVPAELVEAIADRVARMLRKDAAPQTPAVDPWLSVDEAARYIAAPRSRVYDLKARGAIDSRKDGARLVFKRSWLDEYLEGGG